MKKCVLFDTGSSINIITKKIINEMRIDRLIKLKDALRINLLNGSYIESKEMIYLDVTYDKKRIRDVFYVIGIGIVDVILDVEMIKKFEKNKSFSVDCQIKTKGDQIINWTRPIKSYKYREDFKKLIHDYEKRGYIERSKSLWLNPVVLNRKKSGELRFTLDMRRINDIVELDVF
ncbi:Pol polyprotein [Dictyocoela muelleri]|nr:Pol polyprotein [Dictyocoela muelleri]